MEPIELRWRDSVHYPSSCLSYSFQMDEKSLQRGCVTMEYSFLLDLGLRRTQGRSIERWLACVSVRIMKGR